MASVTWSPLCRLRPLHSHYNHTGGTRVSRKVSGTRLLPVEIQPMITGVSSSHRRPPSDASLWSLSTLPHLLPWVIRGLLSVTPLIIHYIRFRRWVTVGRSLRDRRKWMGVRSLILPSEPQPPAPPPALYMIIEDLHFLSFSISFSCLCW